MPTYEYECTKCGHQFEAVQSMKDPHLTKCPQPDCDGTVRRKIGRGAGIIFKGSGFYQTDYRSESYKAGAKSDSAAAKTDSAAASTSTASGGSDGGSGGAAAAGSGTAASGGGTSPPPPKAPASNLP